MSDLRTDEISVERTTGSGARTPQPRRGRRQRRPSGAPPPLPRKIGMSGKVSLILSIYFLVITIVLSFHTPLLRPFEHANTWVLLQIARARTPWLTHIARAIKAAGSGWGITVLGLGTVAALMIFRRWRHLIVFLGSLFVLTEIAALVYDNVARPRPVGVSIIGGWGGYATPSPPVMMVTIIFVGITYGLVVAGRARSLAKKIGFVVVAMFGLSRLYLAVDHPADVLMGIVLSIAVGVLAFRIFTPNEVFPVAYRRGKTAHLDVTGRRGEAIRNAVRDQLGLTVIGAKPVGLESSGGSTPLRLEVEGDAKTYVFAKLYARSHVRADRWYKMWRTILYGTLEDETPFQTVRRFVEYEDYMLRLLRDSGIPVPAPYGIVEITPEREYMMVMEFFQGAVEIGEAVVDDQIIDQGLDMLRKLWDSGVAHRDIKPGNLMVRDGKLLLIDAAFAQVRPSPWRQAVDLANMMLVLAVRSDAERVYNKALKYFSPEEIAEAFAATRGVASPSQLRTFMKADGRDLLREFRALAPTHRPIAIQRWSVRRVLTAVTTVLVLALISQVGIKAFFPVQNLAVSKPSECLPSNTLILAAQAVPSAASLPCIATLPSGWKLAGAIITTGRAQFWLDSDRAGRRAVTVTLTDRCEVSGAEQVPSDEPGATRYEKPLELTPRLHVLRSYVFEGGCATYSFDFAPGVPSSFILDADKALSFIPRSMLVDYVERQVGLALCGRGASCPV